MYYKVGTCPIPYPPPISDFRFYVPRWRGTRTDRGMSLPHVAVENAAQQVQDWDRELAEYLPMKRPDDVGCFDEDIRPQVVPVISDEPFPRAPSCLELPEPLIARFRPAQTEGPVSVIAAPFDRLPHDQVVCPEMLKGPVRGAVFVEDLISEREIDVGGNRCSPERGQDDEPHIP